jgi:hypothetical protein
MELRRVVWAAALGLAAAGVMAGAAWAAPGQCMVSGYETFPCEVAVDGGGVTFGLPDGQVFAFALTAADEGQGYLIAADAGPGQPPDSLGRFTRVPGEDGCWMHDEDLQFCVLVEQAP